MAVEPTRLRFTVDEYEALGQVEAFAAVFVARAFPDVSVGVEEILG